MNIFYASAQFTTLLLRFDPLFFSTFVSSNTNKSFAFLHPKRYYLYIDKFAGLYKEVHASMCPRTKEQNELIRMQRREQILDVAARAYFRTGGSFDIRDVAREAELGYGTVYHYYPNRHLLIEDVLGSGFEQCEQVLAEWANTRGGLPDKRQLLTYCKALLRLWLSDARAYLVYKMAAEHYAGLPEKDRYSAKRRFMERLYVPLQSIAQCEDDSVDHMFAVLVGCCGLHYYAGNSDLDVDRIAQLAMQAITKET
ncbi:TetR/AcrR family transcriptional regulator [Paenibacillus sp. FSL R5-0345]|uniref:TetR/AcrR family transcriptional regulator n=1 Tax=Paenibacillus sp. FSL R5-0345 TaxID=1536770 RepID=UPI001E2C5417|nr:TetR/AcrR family transcriptional regulator [Paenibacillus sp. FSL R5-0345]